MDPVTHALVGLGVGALSGQPLSPYNPLYCAAVLGAVAPDADVLTLLRGKVFFMRQHRGASHSFVGVILFSLAVSAIIYHDFSVSLWLYLPWALAGACSHIFLDCLNSYGTQLWWPFSRKRLAGNLLMLIDPVLASFLLPVFFSWREPQQAAQLFILATSCYLLLRAGMRACAHRFLLEEYNLGAQQIKCIIMPALHGIASWDFRIAEQHRILLGTLNLFPRRIHNSSALKRQGSNKLVEKALQSRAGHFFRQLTAHYYFSYWEEKGRLFVRLLDLRFQKQRDFFYHLTMVFNDQLKLEEASFQDLHETIPLEPR